MTRPACALLNADALRHNFLQVRRCAPRAKIMAVVKANGYGHGMLWAARTPLDADAIGVACTEEGVALREAGIAHRICVLEGFFGRDELALSRQHQLDVAVHCEEQLRALETEAVTTPINIWLKVDTGMHRLGFAPADAPRALTRLKATGAAREIRLLSHLACADDPADPATAEQIKAFQPLVRDSGLEASLANSAGIMAWPDSHFDWVRPGILLYGASPVSSRTAAELGLRPVMTLETRLISVNRRRQGDAIGYGGEWRCPVDMPVGVAAIGYGDGYPRHTPSGTPVLVNGSRAVLIGRVSMEMITIDLRNQPTAQIGDRVVLWGDGLPVEEIAHAAGTVSYELLCQLAKRIPRVVESAGAGHSEGIRS